MKTLTRWLARKWQPRHPKLLEAYGVVFASYHGQLVLQDLMDNVYCVVAPQGASPEVLADVNGRRAVVDAILQNIDAAQQGPRRDPIVHMEVTDAEHVT